jgi:hypothetical protein
MTIAGQPGYIQGRDNTFSYGDPLPSQVVNLFQDDLAELSNAIVNSLSLLFLPCTFTSDWKMPVVAGPDQVTVEDAVNFMVGGVLFNTHGMATRIFQIPDNSTRFLRVSVDPGCGLLQAYQTQPGVIADPLVRNIMASFTLVPGEETDAAGTGGGPSTNTSMRLLQATKAGPGSTPVITLYANSPVAAQSSQSGGTMVPPAGTPLPWFSDILPSWGLLLDGAFYSRTIYSGVYSVIGNVEGDILPANGVSAISVNSGADTITIDRALPLGYVVRFVSTGTLPGGLQAGVDYWICNPNGTSFQVATTPTGLAVDITDNGSGTLTVLSWSFRTPIMEGYGLRGKDNGRGIDTQAASRLARGDGTTGDAILTIQMDGIKHHNHPLGNGGGAQGASSLLNYQNWNAAGAPYNVYTLDGVAGDTINPAAFANVPQAPETTVRNRSCNWIISTGLN